MTDPTFASHSPVVPNDAIELWTKYEEVAMHFNDLMMRWRLQAIGGLATLSLWRVLSWATRLP